MKKSNMKIKDKKSFIIGVILIILASLSVILKKYVN